MLRRNRRWPVWIPRSFKFSIFVSFSGKSSKMVRAYSRIFEYLIKSYIGWITKYFTLTEKFKEFSPNIILEFLKMKISRNSSYRWPMNFENSWLRIWPGQFTLSLRKIITRKSYQPGQKHEGLKSIGIVKWRSMTVFLWNE